MSVIDSVLSRFGYVRGEQKGLGPGMLSLIGGSYSSGYSARPSSVNMGSYLGRYADQAWVYSCVSILASKCSSVELKIYRKTAEFVEELPFHPIKKLIDSANPFMNGHDLIESIVGFYSLSGNAYCLLDAFEGSKPTEMYVLDPKCVKIVADKDKFISGYEYQVPGSARGIPLNADEVLHFKTWNPIDPFYGIPPIAAARDSSDSLMSADRMNKSFFDNYAQTGVILGTDQPLADDTAKRIVNNWEKNHAGKNRAFKTGLLHSGLKLMSTTVSHKDMLFPDLKRMSREDILSVYHIPPVMVGVFDEANYSNANIQRRIFWLDTAIPILKKLESVINERLVAPYDGNVFAAFDISGINDIQDDRKSRAEEDEILTRSGIKTINEVRGDRKLPPVEWGKTWNAPFTVSPITTTRPSNQTEDQEETEQTEQDDTNKDDNRDVPDEKSIDAIVTPKSQDVVIEPVASSVESVEEKALLRREGVWASFKGVTEAMERRWKPVLVELFNLQEKEVVGNLRDKGEALVRQFRLTKSKDLKAPLDVILFDGGQARKAFRKEGKKLMTAILSESANLEADRYSLPTFQITNPRVMKWLDEKAFKFADEINSTTEEALASALKSGISSGETIDEIARRIEVVFDEARGYRTEMIARTETISASNQGAMEEYRQSGVVKSLEWVTARDEKVRDSHRIDGEQVELGSRFSNGLQLPGEAGAEPEDVINCRCTIAPVVQRG